MMTVESVFWMIPKYRPNRLSKLRDWVIDDWNIFTDVRWIGCCLPVYFHWCQVNWMLSASFFFAYYQPVLDSLISQLLLRGNSSWAIRRWLLPEPTQGWSFRSQPQPVHNFPWSVQFDLLPEPLFGMDFHFVWRVVPRQCLGFSTSYKITEWPPLELQLGPSGVPMTCSLQF